MPPPRQNHRPIQIPSSEPPSDSGPSSGGNAEFKGVAGSVITKTFDLLVGKTGLDKKEALENGFDPVEKEI